MDIANLKSVKGDRNLLKQVFVNLLSNAFKYTGKKKAAFIKVRSYKENSGITYFVKDDGTGFDTRYYDKSFGVF